MKSIVVIPTYNEAENIESLLSSILSLPSALDVLVVDDSSPDGTAGRVHQFQKNHPEHASRITTRIRGRKSGLGSAYREGFDEALRRGYDAIFEMDADHSHDPKDLPRMLTELQNADLVLGSRYVLGGQMEGWPLRRKILSRAANLYAQLILGVPVRDLTGGFKCFRREALLAVDVPTLRSDGYTFQIETTIRILRKGYSVREIPIVFRDRELGESKISSWRVIFQTLWLVLKLRFTRS